MIDTEAKMSFARALGLLSFRWQLLLGRGFTRAEQLYASYPQFKDSVGVVPSNQTNSWRDEVDFGLEFKKLLKYVPKHFRLPKPRGELIRLTNSGECLHPLIQDGDVVGFDPSRPAEDGDIVLVLWSENTRKSDRYKLSKAKLGFVPPPIMAKRLYLVEHDYCIGDKEVGFRLEDDMKVLGVACEVVRDGQKLYKGV